MQHLKFCILAVVVSVYFFGNQNLHSRFYGTTSSGVCYRGSTNAPFAAGRRVAAENRYRYHRSRFPTYCEHCRMPFAIIIFPFRASPYATDCVCWVLFRYCHWSRSRLNFSAFANNYHWYSNSISTPDQIFVDAALE